MPRDLDLDLGSGHMAHRRTSLTDLYLHTKFHTNRRNFVDEWTYVHTDGRTDTEAGFITVGRLPNNATST